MSTLAFRKPHADRAIEGLTAKWYASNTGEMMKQYVDLARQLSNEIPQGSAVLEVAPGPGYFCIELARLGSYAITGVDLSHTMVEIARRKAAEAGVEVTFQQGSASNIPLPANSFDFLLCRAAFKNFARPVAALEEMCRVLKPGGRGLIIDLNRKAAPEEVRREIDAMQMSRLNKLLTKIVFKTMLIRSAYTREEFNEFLAQTRFTRTEVREKGMGLEVSLTK